MPTGLRLFDEGGGRPSPPGRVALGPRGRPRREFEPEPETWTARMARALARLHAAEMAAPREKRDRQLIVRLRDARWYLHERSKRPARRRAAG